VYRYCSADAVYMVISLSQLSSQYKKPVRYAYDSQNKSSVSRTRLVVSDGDAKITETCRYYVSIRDASWAW